MKPKKLLSFILSAAMLLSLLPTGIAFAEAAVTFAVQIDNGKIVELYDTDGDGYYEIGTADELYAFAAAVNQFGYNLINGKLTSDITVNEKVPASDGTFSGDTSQLRLWKPIGYVKGSDYAAYYGTFDGNGKTISGIYCNNNDVEYVGLFGYLLMNEGMTATVKNLTVKDSYFYSDTQISHIGAVVGYSDGGKVIDCRNDNSTIYCTASGDVGGVVGYSTSQYASDSYTVTVQGCSNSGTVCASSSSSSGIVHVGGVVGYSYAFTAPVELTNCTNSGSVSATGSPYYAYVGGVVGYSNTDELSVELAGCSNSGTVSASSSSSYGSVCAGGVIGGSSTTQGGTVTIQNCYNSNAVSVESKSSYGYSYAGGVVGKGYASSGTVTVRSCYNVGSLSAEKAKNGVVGEIIGNGSHASDSATAVNCYYVGDDIDEDEEVSCLPEGYFEYGYVAYLLNNGSDEKVWKQTIGVDKYPNFTGLEVLSEGEGSYVDVYNDLSEFKIHSVGDDKKSAVVVLKEAGAYTIVFADYEDEELANVKGVEVIVDEEQPVLVKSDEDFTLGTGDKIMLWKSLSDITPLCDAYEVK